MAEEEIEAYRHLCAGSANILRYNHDPALPLMPLTLTPVQAATQPQSLSFGGADFITMAAVAGTYNAGDIAVINNIITSNGLNWTLAPSDGSSVPVDWREVIWSSDLVNKRVTSLLLSGKI